MGHHVLRCPKDMLRKLGIKPRTVQLVTLFTLKLEFYILLIQDLSSIIYFKGSQLISVT